MRLLVRLALLLIAAPLPLVAQEPVEPASGGYRVDFDNQKIRVVLTALAEAAGLNVTFSDLPDVATTLRLAQPVPKAELLNIMRNIVESNGLVMTIDGSLVRIEKGGGAGAAGGAWRPRVELFTYRLKHADAAKLAPVLMSLLSGAAPVTSTPNAQQGEGPNAQQGEGQVQGSWIPGPGEGQPAPSPAVAAPENGNNGNNGNSGRGFFRRLAQMMVAAQTAQAGPATPDAPSQVRVVAEESTNTLLIRATRQEWEVVKQLVDVIDLRPLQALIEVTIAEVTRTHDLDVGVSATVTQTRTGKGTDAKATLPAVANARDFLLQLTGGRGTIDFAAALNALAARGNLRVVSLPVVIAQNNKQATLNVGASRPFVQTAQTVPNDPTNQVRTIQYLDVGTKLVITPRINADGYVNLEVTQTANSATNEVQFDAPVLSKREATTQVFLRDGQTTVIGGLTDNTHDYSSSGIPVLRSLPVIGGLFGSTHRSDVRSELYMLLTPHIISSDADIDRFREAVEQHSDLLKDVPLEPIIPPGPGGPLPLPGPAGPADTLDRRRGLVPADSGATPPPAGPRQPTPGPGPR